MEQLIEFIGTWWKAAFEILLLTAVIYYFLLLFRGTRGAAVLTGFITALVVLMGVTQIFQLEVLNWILSRVLALLAVAVLVIFQPELRRALAQLGRSQLLGGPAESTALIDVLVKSASALAQKRRGALMAVECEVGFRGIGETGVPLDARATVELLTTVFYPTTPLHDGGVVLRGGRVVAAGCVFPLTQQEGLRPSIGLRHRAAIGLSEETDAVIVVVSEETGQIAIAQGGRLVQGLDADGLRAYLTTKLMSTPPRRPWVVEWFRRAIASLITSRPGTEAGPDQGFAGDQDHAAGPAGQGRDTP
ncbi:TIGR00159 family protein [bacterium]|nr:TIGR00159 family protein [bacterium]